MRLTLVIVFPRGGISRTIFAAMMTETIITTFSMFIIVGVFFTSNQGII